MNVIYCYDAYCGWCYGFSDIIKRLKEEYQDSFNFEILSGGMIMPEERQHIGVIAPFILESYERIESMTGVKFGEDYLWHLRNPEQSDWFPHSQKAAEALNVIKDLRGEIAFDFARDLQYSLFYEGRDLTDNEAYRHLLHKYHIDIDDFYEKLESDEYLEKAKYDFALVKQLQVKGYPAVLLQISVDKFYLMANGYTSWETMKERFTNVIAEINN